MTTYIVVIFSLLFVKFYCILLASTFVLIRLRPILNIKKIYFILLILIKTNKGDMKKWEFQR